ncbi:Glucose 1-dehydrogenase 4 [Brevundimonas sp. SH203]|nr:Glucose 1-dehydrogenase 4 [Brevundimonas sp. SH203]
MKKAIVTGGSGLIGSGLCQALSDRGWEVASFDLKPGEGAARHIDCDVGDEQSVARAFQTLGWSALDLLVNNGGVADPVNGLLVDLSLADWRKVVDSHLTGAFLMCRSAIPLLRDGGSIVNMASTRAFMSEPETEA